MAKNQIRSLKSWGTLDSETQAKLSFSFHNWHRFCKKHNIYQGISSYPLKIGLATQEKNNGRYHSTFDRLEFLPCHWCHGGTLGARYVDLGFSAMESNPQVDPCHRGRGGFFGNKVYGKQVTGPKGVIKSSQSFDYDTIQEHYEKIQ